MHRRKRFNVSNYIKNDVPARILSALIVPKLLYHLLQDDLTFELEHRQKYWKTLKEYVIGERDALWNLDGLTFWHSKSKKTTATHFIVFSENWKELFLLSGETVRTSPTVERGTIKDGNGGARKEVSVLVHRDHVTLYDIEDYMTNEQWDSFYIYIKRLEKVNDHLHQVTINEVNDYLPDIVQKING